MILFEDPPAHTMHRGLMSRVFTPRRMAALEDQVRDFCVSCLDPLVGSDGFDIITELAAQLPMRVIGMLLGIPEEDQVAVRDKTDADLRTRPGQPMEVQEENVASGDIFADYIEWRSKHPSDDLMTQLLNAEFEDEEGETRTLTRQEVLTYTAVLAGAGNETTGRLIGWLAKVLAEHPDQRREVVEDRSLIPNVIDETLRFDPTGHATARYVTQDIDYTASPSPPAARSSCSGLRQPRPGATRTPTCSTSTRRHPAPDLRLRAALLPGREPGPARGPGRPGRAPQPLPRVGRRLRRHEARPDLHGPRLGADADRPPLRNKDESVERGEFESTCSVRAVTDARNRRPPDARPPRGGRLAPVVIVLNDTHIGPRLVEDLREYCPRRTSTTSTGSPTWAADKDAAAAMLRGSGHLDHPNFRTPGHHDPAARLDDFDHDGIAAGVIFHGSMNMGPILFVASRARLRPRPTRNGPSPASGFRSTTAGSPTSSPGRPTGTSVWRTSRCGTSTPLSPRSTGPARPTGCAASTSRRCEMGCCPSTTEQALGAVVGDMRRAPHAARHPRR